MKKHLSLLLACLMFAGTIFAQQHLSFKGVPINGTLKEYTDAMVKAGFHYEGTQDGIAFLTGDFAGHRDCHIAVGTLKNYDVVCRIVVAFPDHDTWASLHSDYYQLKLLLTEKYGQPTNSEEKFTTYVGDYDNYNVMSALREEQFEWYANFSTELGEIILTLNRGDKTWTGKVLLIYDDKINSEKLRNAALDDL